MKGIDVSSYQGKIDWEAVKASGIEFAIMRAGYGYSTVDDYFERNMKEAQRVGVKVGIYWFSYAISVEASKSEAEFCHSLIKGYKMEMPVFYDFEYDTERYAKEKGVTYTKASRTAIIKAFCDKMKEHGHKCGIYTNLDYIKYKLDMKPLEEYPLWLADYSNTKGQTSMKEFMRQTTSSGKVQGISGNVDLDECYAEIVEEPEIIPADNNQPSEWAKEAVEWAMKNNILRGDNNGNLALKEHCTVEKTLTFLYRAMKNIKIDIGE